jgi:glycosyltransferase involved in cell wall biosynthesis
VKPKFSITIPVYNRSEYLRAAVRSCLGQGEQDFEVIISDDCSSEDLHVVAASFGDSRIQYSRSETRLGAARNHQRAVSLSTGAYVLVLHSDDLLLPNCLEMAGEALDDREGASAVYFSVTYLIGSIADGSLPMPKVNFADQWTLQKNMWLEKFHGTGPTCCLFRRCAFESVGGFRTSLRLAYDWDLYMRFVAGDGGVIFLPQVLAVYRKHEEQSVQARPFDGLYDMLDLWRMNEYSHWPSREIADLALTALSQSMRRGSGWFEICSYILRSGAAWRLLGGSCEAIPRRLWRRLVPQQIQVDPNYQIPENVDGAVRAAQRLLDN